MPPPATPPPAPTAETVAAFLLIAGYLLRRVETQALMQANAWIEDEIRKVANLQQLLQPAADEPTGGVDYAVYSRPQRHAGGDYYDLSLIDRGGAAPLCAIGIADVAGHGPAAVVETAMIDTILRTYRDVARLIAPTGTAAVADYLNRHMFTRRTRPSFATAFLSVWDGAVRELRFT